MNQNDLMKAIGAEQRRLRVDLHPQPIAKEFTPAPEPVKYESVPYDSLDDYFFARGVKRLLKEFEEGLRDRRELKEKKGAA